ncbi:MAG TPA: metallophosphoesterase [Woeseiaceae bacterium]|nr:metallophosphoesterase [Woeseiaceae bacterium]
MTRVTLLCLLSLGALSACTNQATTPQGETADDFRTGILIFGDSGNHPNYPDQDDFEDLFTKEQYLESEWQEWLEDRRPPDEFKARPFMESPVTGGVVPASGMQDVAKAMSDYCNHTAVCDFGILVGDNIYPSGATLGADGVDDAQRFRDMLEIPFGNMVRSPTSYKTYVTLGNHDWETSRAGGFAQIEYLEQEPGFYMDGPYYSVRPAGTNGDVELFIIDTSMLLASVPVREDTLNEDGSEGSLGNIEVPDYHVQPLTGAEKSQPQWLEEALKKSTARWKFVVAHHPIWSSSGSKFEQARVLRELLLPAMCRYADAYIVGHEHTLEIHTDSCAETLGSPTQKPLVEILSGAASKQRPLNTNFMRHQNEKYPEHKSVFAQGMVWGFSYLALEGDKAQLTMMSVPDEGGSDITNVFEYEFSRRSGDNNLKP